MIERTLAGSIPVAFRRGKALIILGPRQTGKTTLIKDYLKQTTNAYQFFNADDPQVRDTLTDITIPRLSRVIGDASLVIIDEAQRITNIGLTLKLITDEFPDVKVMATGSSSFELSNEINEPLTGRKMEQFLFPLSWQELVDHFGYMAMQQQLKDRIIYGMYPEVVANKGEETTILNEISTGSLYKDVLNFKGIRKPNLVEKLLKAIALQIGQEVKYNELATLLNADRQTIINYIDLLEKAFIIYRLSPLSRNPRKEIATSQKIYFVDNGIRNALISNFSDFDWRQDKGALWENFLITERMKFLHYNHQYVNRYFWRTYAQQEVDYIEEYGGKLHAFEFKWSHKKARISRTFSKLYPNATTATVTASNFDDFLLKDE